MVTDTLPLSRATDEDKYFRLVERKPKKTPVIQYLRFSCNGWLLEAVDFFSNGQVMHKVAGNHPISVQPIELDEIEEQWKSGDIQICSKIEFDSMLNLAVSVLGNDAPRT